MTSATLALALPEALEADRPWLPVVPGEGQDLLHAAPRNRMRLMVKLDGEDQRNFCEAHPGAIEPVPGYWGRKGATFVDCSAVDEPTIVTLLDLAWRNIAPKTLR